MRGSLSPVLVRLPRRTTLGRSALVCVLLLCAAALLSGPPPGCPALAPVPAASPPSSGTGRGGPAGPGDPGGPPTLPAGLVGVAVPLAEPAAVLVLRAGDRVDLIGVGAGATALSGALVVRADPDATLLVAVSPAEAIRVTNVPIGTVFRVIVRT